MPFRDHLESLYAESDDPWKLRHSWYEARKRALTLACLPAARYAHVYEPGCGNGDLSAELAVRCDHLLVSDGVAAAVDATRLRVGHLSGVEVRQAWVPEDWPQGSFDLVVLSELCYFMEIGAIDELVARLRTTLAPGGTVLACHWRWPGDSLLLSGDEVHRRLGEQLALPRLCRVEEVDLLLEVWCTDERSVAERDGRI